MQSGAVKVLAGSAVSFALQVVSPFVDPGTARKVCAVPHKSYPSGNVAIFDKC